MKRKLHGFLEQAIDTQVCSAEDLDMMIDEVETELAVYYTRAHPICPSKRSKGKGKKGGCGGR